MDDPIDKAYHLEVSSPGIDRPMVRKSDCSRWQGSRLKCETSIPCGQSQAVRGKIVDVDTDGFTIERDQVAYGEEPRVVIRSRRWRSQADTHGRPRRDALRADKLAKAEAANQNEEDNDTPIN